MNLGHYEFKGEVMNRSNLIEALTKDTGLPKGKAEEVVKTVFNTMSNALAKGDRVEIRALEALRSKTMMDIPGTTLRQASLSKSSPKSCPFSNAVGS